MPAIQRRLFSDPKPLVEEFGPEFFRQIPTVPGVYRMHDFAGAVLYVGKAKSLRKRLDSYRVANPDRLPRRTLRLLRLVKQITWEPCASESAALDRESELLLSLKPRFNRAGVWRGPARFLAWRFHDTALEVTVNASQPDISWFCAGPFGAHVQILRHTAVRLLWCVLRPERGLIGMPSGWFDGRLPESVAIPAGLSPALPSGDVFAMAEEGARLLYSLARGSPEEFTKWFAPRIGTYGPPERLVLEADLEYLATRLPRCVARVAPARTEYESISVPEGERDAGTGIPGTKLFAFCATLSAQ